MPRTAPHADKLQRIVSGIPDLIVKDSMVYCTVCEKHLRGWHKTHCYSHLKTRTHRNTKQRGPNSNFFFDLCTLICACSLSFEIVNNLHFRAFWSKYAPQWKLPSATYIRSRYVPIVYNTIIYNIKSEVKNKKICVTVQEATDQQANKVVHVLVRCLGVNSVSPSYLILSEQVIITAETIADLTEKALESINVAAEDVLLLVTNATAYMEKAGHELKKKFHQMIHVTCLAHGLHRVSGEIRKLYDAVDEFVFVTKNVFSKSPVRRRAFHNMFPNVPYPPEPVRKRWGTWLKCVLYYSQYFEVVRTFILTLKPTESEAIATSQLYFQNPDIIEDIHTISEQFGCLYSAITRLETENLSLPETISVIANVKDLIAMNTDPCNIVIQHKLQSVLCTNPGYKTMLKISNELVSSSSHIGLLLFYSCAPLTSVDMERFFSLNKNVVRNPTRNRLKEKTIECILLIRYYYQFLNYSVSNSEQDSSIWDISSHI